LREWEKTDRPYNEYKFKLPKLNVISSPPKWKKREWEARGQNPEETRKRVRFAVPPTKKGKERADRGLFSDVRDTTLGNNDQAPARYVQMIQREMLPPIPGNLTPAQQFEGLSQRELVEMEDLAYRRKARKLARTRYKMTLLRFEIRQGDQDEPALIL
jgi:hypothetical protein